MEIFLAGIESESDDLIQSTRYMLNPDENLHPRLSPKCEQRINDGDYDGAVQAAGKALEEVLTEKAPETSLPSRMVGHRSLAGVLIWTIRSSTGGTTVASRRGLDRCIRGLS
jgi:hypothetical protein